MIKIPLSILLSLAVFVIVAGALLLIFGSPKCDSLANTTAYYLKSAIDEVSKDNFYSWDQGGVPSDISYYRTAPIMLCQDKGISYLETILGTTLEPQYKIYYEMFPESGGGTWTEAYPWGGGAAATLRMWAYIRIGTGAFKIGAKFLTKASIFTTYMKKLYGLGKGVKDTLSSTELEKLADDMVTATEVGAMPGTRPADWYIDATKIGEAAKTAEEAAKDGTIVELAGKPAIEVSTGRLVLSSAKQTVYIPVEIYENGVLSTEWFEVYVRKVGGDIVDMSTDVTKATEPGWELFQASPTEMYKDWLDTLPSSLRDVYKEIYVPEDEVGIIASITGKVKDTGFYKNFYKPVADKLKKMITKFKTLGYRVDLTELTTTEINGLKLGVLNALDDDEVAEVLLNQPGIRDKIAKALGVSAEALQAKHIKQFIDKFELNGIIFIPNGDDLEYISSAIKSIDFATKNGITFLTPVSLFEDALGATYDPVTHNIIAITNADKYKIIGDMANTIKQVEGVTEDVATQRALDRSYGFIANQIFQDYKINGITDMTQLYSNSINIHLRDIATGVKAGDEMSAVQLGNFLGFVEQNKGALPTNIVKTRTAYAVEYFKSQGKKMIYLDGPQNILNPNSFYARALFASLGTAGCEGNSICVYSHTALMESPFYLNKTADKYFIRVWRPVEEWQRWAGWQAALKHVPEHPRFYVVSPCLATAKIWKTTYNNEPTIFVYPEKVSLEGESSNYCYADEGLIKTYTEIWLASDVGTIIQTVYSFGLNRALKSATTEAAKEAIKNSYKYVADKVFNIADPITLAQGLLEGVISWPTWPFKTLTWQQISANAGKVGIKEIRTGEQTK